MRAPGQFREREKRLLDRLPLEKRLNTMTFIIIIPLTVLVIYLMATVVKFCNAYNQSIVNITDVNNSMAYFREDLDYTMYRIAIGTMTYQDIHDMPEEDRPYGWEQIKDPHEMINSTRKVYRQLLKRTTDDGNRRRITWIIHCLDQLEDRVNEIEDNLPYGGYDKNMQLLDMGVYMLTEDIAEQSQEYIYYETLHVQEIQRQLEHQERTAMVVSLSLLGMILGLGLILSRRITKSVTEPIQKLCNETERVARGDFTSGPKIESGDELAILTGSFDHMKGEIGRLIEDIRQEQNQRRVMELQLLQEQINPHFLYNTLDTIVWLAEGGQNREVVDMVTSLSEFFRTTLSGGKDFITIKEEMGHIESYLQIQKIRYQDILDYEVTLDESLEEYRILKLTLQPLVENALYHGIKNKRGRGHIWVRGYARDDMAVFEIRDDGAGMTQEEMEAVQRKLKGGDRPSDRNGSASKGGFGLFNVAERLRLNYGGRCSLEFHSVQGEGTTALVCIPLDMEYEAV